METICEEIPQFPFTRLRVKNEKKKLTLEMFTNFVSPGEKNWTLGFEFRGF